MSLCRREVLHIGLESSGAAVIKLAGGRRPAVLADRQLRFTLDSGSPDFTALAECLADPVFKARRVRVVPADSLVHYFIVERPQGVRKLAELRGLIEARFEEQFGLPVTDWTIISDLDPRAQRYLTCAMPRGLNNALRSLLTDRGLQLLSLQPYAVSEINRWHSRVSGGPAWFAATSLQAVTLGYWTRQGWQSMRTHTIADDAVPALDVLAARDSLLHGAVQAAPITCTGIVGQPASIAAIPNLQILGAGIWPGRGEAWSRIYRGALSGAWL